MEDDMNKASESAEAANSSCKCGKYGLMCGHRHFLLRWLVGVVILVIIFCIGVKVGEMKSGFGYGHHYRGGYNMMYGKTPIMRAYPMGLPSQIMQGSGAASTATGTPTK